jgi:hypothetical protein
VEDKILFMDSKNPITVAGKTYPLYSLSLTVTGVYDGSGAPAVSAILNLTPTRVEGGQVEVLPDRAVTFLSSQEADSVTAQVIEGVQAYLQYFIDQRGL